jgi:acetoin utilization protein AcuC
VTTAGYARAVRLLDDLAHERCEGRWLATGGGGYDAYRVVPRSWGLVWLAQAHREVPLQVPAEWRARWADEADRFQQGPPPVEMIDPPGTVPKESRGFTDTNRRTADQAVTQAIKLLGFA